MKKTLLTLFTTIAVCGMSYSQVYAQIDVSVFENKADYDVDMDDFDDTGEISFVGGDNMPSGTVIGNPDGDSGYISGELDIKIIDDGNIAAPRMTLLYTGDDWIFTDKIIIKTESHRYTFDVDRDTDTAGGKITELYTLVFTDESIQLLKDVIDDEDIMLDFRLSGDRKVDGNLMFLDIDAVKEFYEDYVAAGGTKQDLSEVANSFPCEVKDIN